ncbi:MAG: nitroreductase family deazaflavin-dependent oxidoreductase [Candidatus Caldarchaeum sp.]|jgi:deazaflavin-dependent oxidoreductase (nitroreductase family)
MQDSWPPNYTKEKTLKITTRGRKTGKPHTVTIWFGVDDNGRMFVSSLRSRDWVKNILANPEVEVSVKGITRKMRAVIVESEEDKQLISSIWRRKYGLMARIMRLPRDDGISFELKEV